MQFFSSQKRSPEDLVKKAYDTALGRRLHDDYGIPWDILSQMEFEDKETLLGDFISLSGRTGVGDVVNAKGLLLHVTGSPVKRILSVIYGNVYIREFLLSPTQQKSSSLLRCVALVF